MRFAGPMGDLWGERRRPAREERENQESSLGTDFSESSDRDEKQNMKKTPFVFVEPNTGFRHRPKTDSGDTELKEILKLTKAGLGPFQGGAQPSVSADHMSQLMNLAILNAVSKLSGQGKRSKSADSEGPRSGEDTGGKAKDFEGVRKNRRKFKRHPRRIVVDYLADVREKLGVTLSARAWHLRDFSQKIPSQIGMMGGLRRCHYASREGLQFGMEGKTCLMMAHLVQLSKAIHRVALDGGRLVGKRAAHPFRRLLGKAEFRQDRGRIGAHPLLSQGSEGFAEERRSKEGQVVSERGHRERRQRRRGRRRQEEEEKDEEEERTGGQGRQGRQGQMTLSGQGWPPLIQLSARALAG
jgi:hypothetical protein